jgi:hypothetical protein
VIFVDNRAVAVEEGIDLHAAMRETVDLAMERFAHR